MDMADQSVGQHANSALCQLIDMGYEPKASAAGGKFDKAGCGSKGERR